MAREFRRNSCRIFLSHFVRQRSARLKPGEWVWDSRLVQQMTRLHGGSVSVSSAGLGEGSRFEVRLPLAQNEAAPHQTDLRADSAEKNGC